MISVLYIHCMGQSFCMYMGRGTTYRVQDMCVGCPCVACCGHSPGNKAVCKMDQVAS